MPRFKNTRHGVNVRFDVVKATINEIYDRTIETTQK
jgi:hypothetical protein